MTTTTKVIGIYELVAGLVLGVTAVATRSWWAFVVGVPLAAAGVGALLGRGEATSWLRGDIDERRQRAVDVSFRVAFLVLAWWVAAVTAIAVSRSVAVGVWSAGVPVALIAAYVHYVLRLRRV
jgi:hypothetical protein